MAFVLNGSCCCCIFLSSFSPTRWFQFLRPVVRGNGCHDLMPPPPLLLCFRWFFCIMMDLWLVSLDRSGISRRGERAQRGVWGRCEDTTTTCRAWLGFHRMGIHWSRAQEIRPLGFGRCVFCEFLCIGQSSHCVFHVQGLGLVFFQGCVLLLLALPNKKSTNEINKWIM